MTDPDPIALPFAGVARRYLLARPPAAGSPLVVLLPGTGGTADWAADETQLPAFAAVHGFALAVPEARPPDPTKPPKFLTNPPRWNDGSTHVLGPDVSDGPDDVGFLAAVIADALDRTGADADRVTVSGFSNGAGMAFRFAAERAELLAGVVPVAGYRATAATPARPVPTLFVIGDADRLVPVRGGEVRSPWGGKLVRRPPIADTLDGWAAAVGCEPTPRVESDADGVRTDVYPGPTEFRAVTVSGLGHHWPGGRGRLNPRTAGPSSDMFDMNAALWAFARRQRRPGGPGA